MRTTVPPAIAPLHDGADLPRTHALVTPAAAIANARVTTAAQPRRWIVLEADDLGLLYAFNEGIRIAFQSGALTSTCVRANGFAFEHAMHDVLPQCKGLAVGVHLCLNEAGPVARSSDVAALLDARGQLRRGFFWLMRFSRTPGGMRAIETEFRAQIERVLSAGVAIDHLNSHQHVHMIPPIFELTCRLAREYRVPTVRLTRELPHAPLSLRRRVEPIVNSNAIKHHLLNYFARRNERFARGAGLPVTDYFVGVRYTGGMSVSTIRSGLTAVPYGSVEMLLHPAIGPDERDAACPVRDLHEYVAARRRRGELRALCSDRLADFLRSAGWSPTSFGSWAAHQREIMPQESTPSIPGEVQAMCDSVRPSGPLWVSAAHDDSRAFAQLVLAQSEAGERVLDVGTGTGVIAICLARAGRRVTATDISSAAVRTARANARSAGVIFECVVSDLLECVQGSFDLIAFNPPYGFGPDSLATAIAKNLLRRVPLIRRRSGLAMPRRVLRFHQQLMERLIGQAPAKLSPRGRILIHAYEAEVPALQAVLPDGWSVDLLRHSGLKNQTVGMLIRPVRSEILEPARR